MIEGDPNKSLWSSLQLTIKSLTIFFGYNLFSKVIVNSKYIYYMSTKTKFNLIYWNRMFHSYPILKPTFQTPSTFPFKATELYNPTWTLMSVCVCVWRFGISFTYVIESIELKLISVCLINDYSPMPTYIYCASISLECTKVKPYYTK